MKLALTGTPGTGKSTVADIVDEGFKVVHVNDLVRDGYNEGADEERRCLIADIPGLSGYVNGLKGDVILEGHISHLLPADAVVVLRASPAMLRKRLKGRGWSEAKVRENIEAEALDIILVETMGAHKKVYEIDTTNMTPMQVRDTVLEIIKGTDKYKPGGVDFSEEAFL
jgi:adenylate kinase